MSKFLERCSRIDKLNNQITSLKLSSALGLTQFKWDTIYRNEAIQCFRRHLPISCITVSSALVETCLLFEHIKKEKHNKKGSENSFGNRDQLCSLFMEFLISDVPLERLLDSDENIEELQNKVKEVSQVKYILTKNIFNHGNILYPATHVSPLTPLNENKFDPGDLIYPSTLFSTLLPFNRQELLAYGVKGDEPLLETVAYIHLFKTLRFMKSFTEKTNLE
jgi:hypothetical protein